ncbi:MAG: hypothetical protein QXD95_09250 [Nitrososphaeria archaeon]
MRDKGIEITEEMKSAALREAERREPHIRHWFQTGHYTLEQTNVIGFIGEFAACVLLGIDWKSNIRPNYRTIDQQDIIFKGKRISVKTESLPREYLLPVINREINDDEKYGRRLYPCGQKNLLKKYHIVIFGAILRVKGATLEELLRKIDLWYPIGWIEAKKVLTYTPTSIAPFGGRYPYPAFPVKTSELKDIEELLQAETI